MRKLRLIFAVLLVCGMVSVTTAHAQGFRSDPGTGDILGQKKYQSDAHKIFRMVRFVQVAQADSALAADSIVIWDLAADDGVTVTTTTVSGDSAVAGIIVQEAQTQETENNTAVQDRGKRNWTWLQTYGLSQVDNLLIVVDAGDAMGTSTTAGEANPFSPTVGEGRRQGNAGFWYDSATAGATNVQVFIRLD